MIDSVIAGCSGWLLDALDASRTPSVVPHQMHYLCERTRSDVSKDYDEHLDSYTEALDPDCLDCILDRVTRRLPLCSHLLSLPRCITPCLPFHQNLFLTLYSTTTPHIYLGTVHGSRHNAYIWARCMGLVGR